MKRLGTILVAGIIGLVMLTGASGEGCQQGKPVDPNDKNPITITGPSTMTSKVCNGVKNAYLQDAIPSDITGKAIRTWSDDSTVDRGVRSAVHNLWNVRGQVGTGNWEDKYKAVIRACDNAGWKVGR